MFGYDYDYVINKKSLEWLEPIIQQWVKIHRDYLEEYNYEDSLYWYNERANISAFAGAVWKCAGFALEEFSSEKGEGNDLSRGRVDLYFSMGSYDAVVEAKLHWLYLHKHQEVSYLSEVSGTHSLALKDISRTMPQEHASQNIAMTFILPYWKNGEKVDYQIAKFKKEMMTSESSFVAYFDNTTGNDLINSNGHVFNCIVAIGDLA